MRIVTTLCRVRAALLVILAFAPSICCWINQFRLLRRLRSRASLELELIALRHQVSVLRRQHKGRLRLFATDRLLWVWLYWIWPRCGFIEANFFSEMEYVLDLPFYGLPAHAAAQAGIAAKYGYILPTKEEFQSGKPCLFPNAGISFGFEHPAANRSSRTSTNRI